MYRNLLNDIPKDLSEEFFETLVEHGNVTIERIVSKGHTSPEQGWYDQDRHEWVVLLRGSAEIAFEASPAVRLVPGDCLNLPAHQKHRVTSTSSDPEAVWLAVHYGDGEDGSGNKA